MKILVIKQFASPSKNIQLSRKYFSFEAFLYYHLNKFNNDEALGIRGAAK